MRHKTNRYTKFLRNNRCLQFISDTILALFDGASLEGSTHGKIWYRDFSVIGLTELAEHSNEAHLHQVAYKHHLREKGHKNQFHDERTPCEMFAFDSRSGFNYEFTPKHSAAEAARNLALAFCGVLFQQ